MLQKPLLNQLFFSFALFTIFWTRVGRGRLEQRVGLFFSVKTSMSPALETFSAQITQFLFLIQSYRKKKKCYRRAISRPRWQTSQSRWHKRTFTCGNGSAEQSKGSMIHQEKSEFFKDLRQCH